MVGFGFGVARLKWTKRFSGIGRPEFGIGCNRLFTGVGIGYERLSTEINRNLHSENLCGHVWLRTFDRLALVSTPKPLLESRNSLN